MQYHLLLSCLLEVVQDSFRSSYWLRGFPDLPGEAEGVHVAVGSDSRVLEEVPGAADVGAPLQDDILGPSAIALLHSLSDSSIPDYFTIA